MELKTGRASGSAEHRGQVILYSMMMSERRPDPSAGLLLYLRNSSLQEVKAGIHEMRGLVQLRNNLVAPLLDYSELPESISHKSACEKCPHLISCTANLLSIKEEESKEQIIAESCENLNDAMKSLVPSALEHLSLKEIQFFHRYNSMVGLENEECRKNSRLNHLWTKSLENRERKRVALIDLRLILQRNLVHTFEKEIITPNIINVGENVIVSSGSELALSQGHVMKIDASSIEIILDRNLTETYQDWNSKKYYVDKYEYQGTNSLGNIAKFMENNSVAKRLRNFIIDKKSVNFITGLPREVALNGKSILKPLNRVQQKAIFKTLMAENYVLLKGMPGTGKTTVIVALVRLLVQTMNKKVLLTSYTHSAVDNILLKLKQYGDIHFTRLGKKSRIHPEIQSYAYDENTNEDVNIVATTCLGIGHPMVTNRAFDYCIVDEAAQASFLSALGPLFHADKFILVGDPQQLPPVVQSTAAKDMGLDRSLFSLLEDESNSIPLTVQYRMNRRIMDVSNYLTYNGMLECGNDLVANNVINLNLNCEPEWLKSALDGSLDQSVVFINTDGKGNEVVEGEKRTNPYEAEIVSRIINVLNLNFQRYDIGVMAPYRSQVQLLKSQIPEAEVNTVDQYQGRDKDVILYSCTRTTINENEDCILKDERRLNVALTRAKRKIILVGHVQSLERNFKPFEKLIRYLKAGNSICKV